MISNSVGLRLLACGLCVIVAACSDPAVRKARHVEQGKAYMAEGKTADAIIEFRNALKIDARHGEARYELARALDQTGNPAAAREYVRAADLLTDRPEVQVKAAEVLLQTQQFELARKYADQALKVDPRSVNGLIVRAYALAGLQDVGGAVQELQKAMDTAPGDYRPHVSLGAVQALSGHARDAEAAFRRAVETDPSSIQAQLALAYFYWSDRKGAEAERLLDVVIEKEPDNVAANRLLSVYYLADRRPKEAEVPLTRLAAAKDPAATLTLADLYAGSGRASQARPLYESLAASPATRPAAVVRLAGMDYTAGRTAEAHAAVDGELQASPRNLPLLSLKAQWLIKEGRHADALALATRARAAEPESAQAQLLLARAQAASRKPDEAIATYREALRLAPAMTVAQVELSRLLLAAGETDQSLQLAQAARKSAPENPDAQLHFARALVRKGDLRAAADEVNGLVAQLPDSADVQALRGQLLVAQGDRDAAARAFDRALAIDAGHLEAFDGRLKLDFLARRMSDARARIERAIAAAPRSAAVLVTAAQFERADGGVERAEQYLRKAIDVEPADLVAYNQLASLYISQKKLEEGKRELQELVRRQPDAVSARTMIGIIDQLQGRTVEARQLYEAIVGDSPTAAVAANNLAYMYADRGEQLDRALELAQRAKSQMPDNADVSDTLGWAYYKRGMPDMAVKAFEFSVGKDPKNPIYLVHLGLAYAKAGQPEKARAALTQALQLKADVEGAAEARAVLASLQS